MPPPPVFDEACAVSAPAPARGDQAGLAAQQQEALGLTPVLLVPAPLRALLSRFLRRALPQLKVLSHAEVPETKTIRVTALVGAQ